MSSETLKVSIKKARAGEIKNFTGIDSKYEPPESPETVVDTSSNEVQHCVDELLNYLYAEAILHNPPVAAEA